MVSDIPREELDWKERIGQGSTGQVYLGSWRGRPVAIKEIADHIVGEGAASPFSRELHALSTARHPNIVSLIGVVMHPPPCCIVLEFCGGGTVAERLYTYDDQPGQLPLSWSQARKIASDTCAAMRYLHSLDPPIVHRDLKSMNLLLMQPLSSNGIVPQVKLCDFGVARPKAGELGEMTPRGGVDDEWPIMTKAVGTFNWVAPEVFNGHIYDEKVDVYAFAMVCFELVFMELPFEDLEPTEIAALVISGKRPSLEDPPPGVPDAFMRLIEICWSHHNTFRPRFSQIEAQLLQISGGSPVYSV
mmetsp:Transcript_98451/g.284117  ORF Transcript_98451/g.284117 Transcript_98451/m.284117 type:complete len:302 (+) Transcript_98451:81-986(+)